MTLHSATILQDIAALRIADSPRSRRYLAALDAKMQSFLDHAGANPSPLWSTARAGSDREWSIRGITQHAGYMAFFHACPQSRFHHDPRLLAEFKAVIDELLHRQTPLGELTWVPASFPPHPHMSHGQSWWVEPLLLGMNWLREHFSPQEKARIDAALYHAADFIASRPIQEINNRAVIVCAVLALCGRYFDDPRYLNLALEWFHGEPIKVFDRVSGQILEGSGPDGNYSGTTYEYLHLYRIMSGDFAIDPMMIRALKWFARVRDYRGHQMICGAATRVPSPAGTGQTMDILASLERYSDAEPFFQQLIEQYLPLIEAHGGLGRSGHSISPTLWALLEHRPITPPTAPPAWYADMRTWYRSTQNVSVGPEHYGYNEGYESLYFPIRRDYHTTIALRSRSPFKDLQCWSLDQEPPTVFPTWDCASATRAWGLDTSVQNVNGIKIPMFCWVDADIPGLIAMWGKLWRFYVFAQRTTLIISAGDIGPFETDWVINTEVCGQPQVEGQAIVHPGRQGRLCFPGSAPVRHDRDEAALFRFSVEGTPSWFAITDAAFRMGTASDGRISFADSSGSYNVQYRYDQPPDLGEKQMGFSHTEQHRLRVTKSS